MRRLLSAMKRLLRGTAARAQEVANTPGAEAVSLRQNLARQALTLPLLEKMLLRQELGEIHTIDYGPQAIRLHVESMHEFHMRTRPCAKEPGTVAWIEQHLRPGDVFYDIGANVGAYSLIAAKHTRNGARIYAFEPSYLNFYQLCRNVILNECQSSITPVFLPLCAKTGPGPFHYQNTHLGGALHSFGRAIDYKAAAYSPVNSLGTLGFSLDDLVRFGRLPPPNHVKLDVDGLEKDILQGSAAVLGSGSIRSMLLELNEDLSEECTAILRIFHETGFVPLGKYELKAPLFNLLLFRQEGARAKPPALSEIPVIGRRTPSKRAAG
jgi:FkbM family methyltransferase